MRTRIKLCGFTRAEDALEAAKLGVDAIGLVFYPPSPRNVGIEQARAIVDVMPAFVTIVALFVDAEARVVEEIIDALPEIGCLQFHGEESPKYCRQFDRPYIKAVRVRENTDFSGLCAEYQDAGGLLLDSYDPMTMGGTGQCIDWSLMPDALDMPLILAGGLDENTVGKAINRFHPYAVDASSGVESQKGIKNKEKMAAFVRAVNQGDSKTA